MSEYVKHSECENYREEIEKKLMENSLKIVELDSSLKSLVRTNNLILGAVISGMVSIIVILLTRGI